MKSLLTTSLFLWLMLPAAGCSHRTTTVQHMRCFAQGKEIYNADITSITRIDDQLMNVYGTDGSVTVILNATCVIK